MNVDTFAKRRHYQHTPENWRQLHLFSYDVIVANGMHIISTVCISSRCKDILYYIRVSNIIM